MLFGYFDPRHGRPYFEAELELTRLQKTKRFSFLVDTGADNTTLLSSGAKDLYVTPEDFIFKVTPGGTGGYTPSYMDAAKVRFIDPQGRVFGYSVYLVVNYTDPGTEKILLGRDIIDRWFLRYNKAQNVLEADVVGWDSVYP
jgi:hypothetical protein